jgi:hypothetical protein
VCLSWESICLLFKSTLPIHVNAKYETGPVLGIKENSKLQGNELILLAYVVTIFAIRVTHPVLWGRLHEGDFSGQVM